MPAMFKIDVGKIIYADHHKIACIFSIEILFQVYKHLILIKQLGERIIEKSQLLVGHHSYHDKRLTLVIIDYRSPAADPYSLTVSVNPTVIHIVCLLFSIYYLLQILMQCLPVCGIDNLFHISYRAHSLTVLPQCIALIYIAKNPVLISCYIPQIQIRIR